jgi:hypothetical protein
LATEENLDYEAIRDALMIGDIPEELDDILFLSSLLGTAKGWSMIERQAEEDRRELPEVLPQYGHVDLAILAAIRDWPKNKRSHCFLQHPYPPSGRSWQTRSWRLNLGRNLPPQG